MASTAAVAVSHPLPASVNGLAEQQLLSAIRAVRGLFERYFDQNWFVSLVDEVPIDPQTLRDVRALTRLNTLFPGDESEIAHGIAELSKLQVALRRFLLPHIKEKLLVSGLRAARAIRDTDQYILRRCVAMTFEHNLAELELLTAALRQAFDAHSPGSLPREP